MTVFRLRSGLTAILGASAVAFGLAAFSEAPAAAASMPILSGSAVTPETAVVQARFRRNRGARRVYRSRYRYGRRSYRVRRGNQAAAIIGAFGAIAAAAIAAERRRAPVYYYDYGYAPVYGGYYYPQPVYTYRYYPRYRSVPIYSHRYYRRHRGLRRVYRAPRNFYRGRARTFHRGYRMRGYRRTIARPARVFRGRRGGWSARRVGGRVGGRAGTGGRSFRHRF